MKRIAFLTALAMWIPAGACMSPEEPPTDPNANTTAAPGDSSEETSLSAQDVTSEMSDQGLTSEVADQTAEQLAASEDLSTDAARPPCVSVRHITRVLTQTVYVTNHCSRTVSFVIHRLGPDSACLHASPGRTLSYRWVRGLTYQGTTFGCD